MNKLEEYRAAWLSQTYMALEKAEDDDTKIIAIENLFDAAIALDLPVKFNKWASNPPDELFHMNLDDEQLYQHWIDNIYKPE